MNLKTHLLSRLKTLKSRQGYWNFGQQQLFTALSGKRGLWVVQCCVDCLEEVTVGQVEHDCGGLVATIQVREPMKVPGGYVSPWN